MDLWTQRMCQSGEAAVAAPRERVQCVKDTAQGLSRLSRCWGTAWGEGSCFTLGAGLFQVLFHQERLLFQEEEVLDTGSVRRKGTLGRAGTSVASWVN